MVSKQQKQALDRARSSLTDSLRHDEAALVLAEASDRKEAKDGIDRLKDNIQATKATLAEPDVSELVWNAMFEATERIKEDKAPARKTVEVRLTLHAPLEMMTTCCYLYVYYLFFPSILALLQLISSEDDPDRLLDFLASSSNFAACLTVSLVVNGVNGIFKLIQGGSAYGGSDFAKRGSEFTHTLAKAKAEDVPSIVGPVRQLIDSLDRLAVPGCAELDEVIGAVAIETMCHARGNLDREIGYGNIDSDAADKVMDDTTASFSLGGAEYDKLRKTLLQAVTAISVCKAGKKTEEALQLLEVKFRFELARKPERLLDTSSSADVHTFFGIPDGWAKSHGTTSYNLVGALRTQWLAHCKTWDRDRAGISVLADLRPSPRDVNDYWRGLRDRSPDLSLLAEHHWAAAVSSSQPERAFSKLTTMDVPNRRRMEELTLANTLFLRVNKTTVDAIAQELEADTNLKTCKHVSARAADNKTRAARIAESASTDAFAAMGVAIAARSVGHKRLRGPEVRGDDSESESGDSARDSSLLESGDDELSS